MSVNLATLSDEEVRLQRTAIIRELRVRARSQLESALALYIDALGTQKGFEAASDALFSELAAAAYPGGWPALLAYSMRAAG